MKKHYNNLVIPYTHFEDFIAIVRGRTVQLCAGGGIRIPSAGTIAKFINNCSLVLLMFNKGMSDGTVTETCTNADC